MQDAEGNEVMKYFDAEITDSTSIYLQKYDRGKHWMILVIALEMNTESEAVLVQAIRKLL